MVDLSRLMQDAATLEVIEKSAIEAQVLRHDVEAYRACLGYSVSGDHDGRLSDGTLPNNGIAEALDNECRTLSAQHSAQVMQIDELKRELAAAQEARQRAEALAESYRKDAERLDWLEQLTIPSDDINDLIRNWRVNGKRYQQGIRAAIDAAIAGEKP